MRVCGWCRGLFGQSGAGREIMTAWLFFAVSSVFVVNQDLWKKRAGESGTEGHFKNPKATVVAVC